MKRNPDTTFILQGFLSMSGVASNEWTVFCSCMKHLFPHSEDPQLLEPHLCPVGFNPLLLFMGM